MGDLPLAANGDEDDADAGVDLLHRFCQPDAAEPLRPKLDFSQHHVAALGLGKGQGLIGMIFMPSPHAVKRNKTAEPDRVYLPRQNPTVIHHEPFRQKYEKFSSHVSACQRGFLTPAREHKDTNRL